MGPGGVTPVSCAPPSSDLRRSLRRSPAETPPLGAEGEVVAAGGGTSVSPCFTGPCSGAFVGGASSGVAAGSLGSRSAQPGVTAIGIRERRRRGGGEEDRPDLVLPPHQPRTLVTRQPSALNPFHVQPQLAGHPDPKQGERPPPSRRGPAQGPATTFRTLAFGTLTPAGRRGGPDQFLVLGQMLRDEVAEHRADRTAEQNPLGAGHRSPRRPAGPAR